MDRKILLLVIIAAVSTGCADSDTGGTGIQVNEISVEPSEIRAGRSVSVNLEASNAGELEGKVDIEDGNGSGVLTNYCSDLFKIEGNVEASATKPSESDYIYPLDTGDTLRLNWRLRQYDEDEVPLNGYKCNLRFELPFDYSVKSYKQLQIKQNREVQGSTNLQDDISEGPLAIDMEVIGSTADQSNTIIRGDNTSVYITAYNTEGEESSYQGLIELKNFEITTNGNISVKSYEGSGDCASEDSVTLNSGNRKIYRCKLEPENLEQFDSENGPPSVRGEVEASIDYTFVKDLGSRTVKVKYSGQ